MITQMPRQILEEAQIHPSIRATIANYRIASVEAVQAAIREHDVVVVGMSQNPFPKRARQLLDQLWQVERHDLASLRLTAL